jgi:hypothetical protein
VETNAEDVHVNESEATKQSRNEAMKQKKKKNSLTSRYANFTALAFAISR